MNIEFIPVTTEQKLSILLDCREDEALQKLIDLIEGERNGKRAQRSFEKTQVVVRR